MQFLVNLTAKEFYLSRISRKRMGGVGWDYSALSLLDANHSVRRERYWGSGPPCLRRQLPTAETDPDWPTKKIWGNVKMSSRANFVNPFDGVTHFWRLRSCFTRVCKLALSLFCFWPPRSCVETGACKFWATSLILELCTACTICQSCLLRGTAAVECELLLFRLS